MLNNFDMEDMESSHNESDERDIEERYPCFKKRSIAGGKQKSSKKQKRDDSESKCFYFFTLPCILHYFLMFQVVTNNSIQNVEKFPFIKFSYLYSSADILVEFILGVVVYKSYRPFLLSSYKRF